MKFGPFLPSTIHEAIAHLQSVHLSAEIEVNRITSLSLRLREAPLILLFPVTGTLTTEDFGQRLLPVFYANLVERKTPADGNIFNQDQFYRHDIQHAATQGALEASDLERFLPENRALMLGLDFSKITVNSYLPWIRSASLTILERKKIWLKWLEVLASLPTQRGKEAAITLWFYYFHEAGYNWNPSFMRQILISSNNSIAITQVTRRILNKNDLGLGLELSNLPEIEISQELTQASKIIEDFWLNLPKKGF